MSANAPIVSYLPESFDNPFINKLPDEAEEKDFAKNFSFLPKMKDGIRSAPNRERSHSLIEALYLRVAIPRHWDLDTALSKLIRWSYVNRNPRSPGYWTEYKARWAALGNDPEKIFVPPTQKHAGWGAPVVSAAIQSGLLIGGTGGGKSVSVERDLQQYPPVIYHGDGLNITQVPALKLEVTKGPKDLASTFFQSLDQRLGTSYYLRFRKLTEYEMLLQMTNLCFVHAIGVVVADEFQNFDDCNIPKFLLRLNNVSKTAVLGIGTYKIERFFDEAHELKLYRRYKQARIKEWVPLDREKEWPIYFEKLLKIQVTRQETLPLPELSNCLFEESQGIPDFATRLHVLAQDWLIARNHSGKRPELITPNLIVQTAQTQLKPIRELLNAYKHRDWDFIRNFADIRLPDVEELLAKTYATTEIQTSNSQAPEPAIGPSEAGAPSAQPVSEGPRLPAARIPRCKPDAPTVPCKLVNIVGAGNKDPKSAYQALKNAGLIKNPTEFWRST